VIEVLPVNRRDVVMAGLGMMSLASGSAAARGGKTQKRPRQRRRTLGSAADAAQVDAVLGPLAELMWHGEADDRLSIEKLEGRIARGDRIMVQCTNQAMLSVRALARSGITARMINPLAASAWETSWGHTSMEVRVAGHWQVFDPTGNAQLVDQDGNGMDVSTACITRPILARSFAFDSLWGWEGAPDDLKAYYERIFQIPIIYHQQLWRFHDAANRGRIERIGKRWQWANTKDWKKLTR
jgi:hypothetical protein